LSTAQRGLARTNPVAGFSISKGNTMFGPSIQDLRPFLALVAPEDYESELSAEFAEYFTAEQIADFANEMRVSDL
jgi:hypothetical protein